MRQTDAVAAITDSLKEDPLVKAVFLKGSMGRGEEDVHSDVDIYVMVDEGDQSLFLKKRRRHLESYASFIFYDDIYIIAPQIIAVYENLLHVDLFTVTEDTLIHKDYFHVLYDPEDRMEKHRRHQNLWLADEDFLYAVDDVAFFFLQYKKAADRGNELWAVKVAHDIALNLAKILLRKYTPERAQLGMKSAWRDLPSSALQEFEEVYRRIDLEGHVEAVCGMAGLMESHLEWLEECWGEEMYTLPFLKRMIKEIKDRTPV